MMDYVTPTKYGDLSSKSYREINCSNMQFKDLVKYYYPLPLGEGTHTDGSGERKNAEWEYSEPGTLGGITNRFACDF